MPGLGWWLSLGELVDRLIASCAFGLSLLWLFATPWTVSPPSSSVQETILARILLVLVAISFSRGSSQPRDGARVSCIGRWILYCWPTWTSLITSHHQAKKFPCYRDSTPAKGQKDHLIQLGARDGGEGDSSPRTKTIVLLGPRPQCF